MPPRYNDVEFILRWDGDKPNVREWLSWLVAITPLIWGEPL